MADVNFIEFGTQPFFIERTSPYTKRYEVYGIRMLPNNPLPYVQTTNVSGGIYLEDWECIAVTRCGVETDLTDYFVLENVFTDDNGDNQFTWSLTNVPFDFGCELITLKVTQLIGETFYSNWFQLTDYDSDKYIRVDYRSYNQDVMQSIELPIAFKQEFNPVEIETYYETSTKNTVINTIKSQSYENWLSKIISNDLLLKVIRVFTYKYTYVNLLRCNLFEAIEQKEYTAEENFNENIIKLTFNKSDVYNPLMQFIPVVNPLLPSITLNSVIASGASAIYNFGYTNFTPDYLVFEYSSDEVTWTSSNKQYTSPQSVPFNETGTWYFRVSHPQAISNVITLDLGSSVIAVNDTAYVDVGETIDIPVLLNDTLVGETTVTAISTPTNGVATIIDSGTKIRYVHNGSDTMFDSFTYTISNGITSDTATISVSIEGLLGIAKTFQTSFIGKTLNTNACVAAFNYNRYFIGSGSFPSINDFIYTDLSLTTIFNGHNLWFPIAGGKVIKINTLGKVIDMYLC